MIDLSGFVAFDFKEGVPYISVTNNGITFNKSVIMKMDYPEFVKLLIDSSTCQIALQISNKEDDKAVRFHKDRKNGVQSVRWNAKDLLNTLSKITGWDLCANSYRVVGEYYAEQKIMLFDLNKAIELK